MTEIWEAKSQRGRTTERGALGMSQGLGDSAVCVHRKAAAGAESQAEILESRHFSFLFYFL